MKIARTSSTLGIVRSRSRSRRDFEIFLHLPQYKLSRPISQLLVGRPKLIIDVRHFLLQAGNYASSIKSYADFSAKVDTTAPDILYGAKWGHLVQKP